MQERGTRTIFCGLVASMLSLSAITAAPALAAQEPIQLNAPLAAPLDPSDLGRMARAGVNIVRIPFSWARVLQHNGSYDWRYYDRMVGSAANAGIELLPIIASTPKSIPHRGAGWPGGKGAMEQYRRFLTHAVARYGRHGTFFLFRPDLPHMPLRSWQIWNEPNREHYASGRVVNAKNYAQLLKTSSKTIRRVDRQAQIVTAGIPERANSNYTAWDFMRDLYRVKGARRSFDVFAFHAYARSPAGVHKSLMRMRDAFHKRLHDPKRPIWITEFGYPSEAHRFFNRPVDRDAKRQAKLLRRTIDVIRDDAQRTHTRQAFAFCWRDVAPLGHDRSWDAHSGLFRHDGRAKPAWAVFNHANHRSADSTPL